MKRLLTLALALTSLTIHADDVKEKLAFKAEKFLESFQKEINLVEIIDARNKTYPATLTRTTKTPVADIGDKDIKWTLWKKRGGAKEQFITDVIENKCSQVIQLLTGRMSYIKEVFVMDKMGANICAYPPTSDYDQGDEDKWTEPFLKNNSPHVGDVSVDESTGENQAQVSLVIKKDSSNIGVITIGIKSK